MPLVQFFAPKYNAQRGKTIKFLFYLPLFLKLHVKSHSYNHEWGNSGGELKIYIKKAFEKSSKAFILNGCGSPH